MFSQATANVSLLSGKLLGLVGAIGFVGQALQEAIAFQSNFTRALSVQSNLTDDQRKAIESLSRSLAIDLGISASKMAKTFQELAEAGLDANQQIAAIPTVAKFAATAQISTAKATDVLVESFRGLHQETGNAEEDARRITKIADFLTIGQRLAATSTAEFGDAVAAGIPVAAKYGLSLNDLGALLLAFSNAGKKGAAAALSLDQALRELTDLKDLTKLQAAFNVRIFDTDGKLKPLSQTFTKIATQLQAMSPIQAKATLQMAGISDRTARFLQVLLKSGTNIDAFSKALEESGGALEQQLGTSLDALDVRLNQVKAVLNDIAIQFLPPFIDGFLLVAKPIVMIGHVLADLDKALGGIGSSMLKAASAVTTLAITFGVLIPKAAAFLFSSILGFGNLVSKVLLLDPALRLVSGTLSLLGGVLKIVGGGIDDVGDAIISLSRKAASAIPEITGAIGGLLGSIGGPAGHLIGGAIGSIFGSVLGGVVGVLGTLTGLAVKFVGVLVTGLAKGADLAATLADNLRPVLGATIGTAVAGALTVLVTSIKQVIDQILKIPAVDMAIKKFALVATEAFQNLLKAIAALGPPILSLFNSIGITILKAFGAEKFADTTTALEGVDGQVKELAQTFLGLLEIITDVTEKIGIFFLVLKDNQDLVPTLFGDLVDIVKATFADIADVALGFGESILGGIAAIVAPIEAVFNSILAWTKVVVAGFGVLFDVIRAGVATMLLPFGLMIQGVELFLGALTQLLKFSKPFFDFVIAGFNAIAGAILSAIEILGKFVSAIIKAGAGTLGKFLPPGLKEGAEAVADEIANLIEGATKKAGPAFKLSLPDIVEDVGKFGDAFSKAIDDSLKKSTFDAFIEDSLKAIEKLRADLKLEPTSPSGTPVDPFRKFSDDIGTVLKKIAARKELEDMRKVFSSSLLPGGGFAGGTPPPATGAAPLSPLLKQGFVGFTEQIKQVQESIFNNPVVQAQMATQENTARTADNTQAIKDKLETRNAPAPFDVPEMGLAPGTGR